MNVFTFPVFKTHQGSRQTTSGKTTYTKRWTFKDKAKAAQVWEGCSCVQHLKSETLVCLCGFSCKTACIPQTIEQALQLMTYPDKNHACFIQRASAQKMGSPPGCRGDLQGDCKKPTGKNGQHDVQPPTKTMPVVTSAFLHNLRQAVES